MSDMAVPLDVNIEQFFNMLFNAPPMPPFSYLINLGDIGMSADAVLGPMLIAGAQHLYNKQLSDLTEVEIGKLREYMLSIGWDADYNLAVLYKDTLDYYPDGEPYVKQIKINNWQISFKPADPSLQGSCSL